MVVLNVFLSIHCFNLKKTISVLQGNGDEVTILDGGESPHDSSGKKQAKKSQDDKAQADNNQTELYIDGTATGKEDELIEDTIAHTIGSLSGSWDIWTESCSSRTFSHNTLGNSNERMISASLIKLFIMGAAYQEIENSIISHDDVYQDIHNMIIVSDNDAANRLIRMMGQGETAAGFRIVNEFSKSIGCNDTEINRLMLENNGMENYTSSHDCALLLRMIYNGNCVSKKWSDEMLDHLKAQTINDRIPKGIPYGMTVAHKTGNLSGICNGDVGIVFTEDEDYIICVIYNGDSSEWEINNIIAEISEKTYNYYRALK